MTSDDWNEKYQKLMRTLCRRGVKQFVVTDELYDSILSMHKSRPATEGPLVWAEGPNGEVVDQPVDEPWDGQTLDFRGRKILRRRDLKPEDSASSLDTILSRTEEEVTERHGVLGQD